MTDFHKEIN